MEPEPRLIREEDRNRASRDSWQLFAAHRHHVTQLIASAAAGHSRASRLCVLGAGNSNDLDLNCLRQFFTRIELVDWDSAALLQGVTAQGLSADSAIDVSGGRDLLLDGESALPEIACADVVASVCLLSQLLEQVAEQGQGAGYLARVQAVRKRHLQLLIELTCPGGCSLLVTDLVSSETAPELVSMAESDVIAFLPKLIAQQNFFTGLNPAVLLDVLQRDPDIRSLIERIEVVPPWLWRFGQRVYAVYAIRFRRIKNRAS
jgi:hypothetical protein